MALKELLVDQDVYEMAVRIAGRLGKGVSEAVQDGLICIARGNGWGVTMDEDEKLDEGEREEVFAFWSGLNPVQRGAVLDLLDEDDEVVAERLENLREQKLLMNRVAALEDELADTSPATPSVRRDDAGSSVELSVKVTGDDETKGVVTALMRWLEDWRESRS
jgi:hypothetical protein